MTDATTRDIDQLNHGFLHECKDQLMERALVYGYRETGRGALWIIEERYPEVGYVTPDYCPPGFVEDEMLEAVGSYDPEREFVIVITRPEGGRWYTCKARKSADDLVARAVDALRKGQLRDVRVPSDGLMTSGYLDL